MRMKRREFLKTSAAVAACTAFAPSRLLAESAPPPRVVAVHGTDIPAMLAAGIAALGGWSAYIKPGAKVALKPNAGWASTPEQGANTHPALVEACARACLAAGAADVVRDVHHRGCLRHGDAGPSKIRRHCANGHRRAWLHRPRGLRALP